MILPVFPTAGIVVVQQHAQLIVNFLMTMDIVSVSSDFEL